jgi:hypothetical protein
MSLATFKKKTTNKYSTATKRSGKPPGGYWLNQGPFGQPSTTSSVIFLHGSRYYGPEGFSINGGTRSISVGKDMGFSQQGTRFKGAYPIGNGGSCGQYYQATPVLNAGEATVDILGNQHKYIKPSTLSTKGMINKKYKWIRNGGYPNTTVQPMYTGDQTDSASQGVYIQALSAANVCVTDVNNTAKYVGDNKCNTNGCMKNAGSRINRLKSNAPYTKFVNNSQDSSQYTLQIQRKCANPRPDQKPFPYRVSNGTGILRGGISVNSVGSACNLGQIYTSPPDWYTK